MSKMLMFMIFVWIVVSLGGSVAQGAVPMATTVLTEDIDDDDTTITVSSTEGFPDTGFIQILDERIGYASTTDTTFKGNFAQPTLRGAQDTEAVAHSAGELARTIESAMLNQSISYKLATLTDASGVLAFVTIPLTFIQLLGTFFVLPLSFLGTDLQILTYIWGALSIAIIVSIGIALAGGRRV